MISDAQIKQYNEEGYTIVENVFNMDSFKITLKGFVWYVLFNFKLFKYM